MILRTYLGFLLTSHGVQRAILGIPAQRAPEIFLPFSAPPCLLAGGFSTDTDFFNQNFPYHAD